MLNTLFFNVDSFVHKALFEESESPWDPLDRLPVFFEHFEYNKKTDRPHVFFEKSDQIHIGENVHIEPGVLIKGPCIIGDGCEIRHGAYLRGGVILGYGCIVGHASEVKNSLLLHRAKLPHFNYCGDSILGNDTNMGAGAITANVRFDKKEVVARFQGEKYETGRVKLGLILGDGGNIGCNVVTQPGTLIAPGTCIPPQKHYKGLVTHDRTLT